MSNKISKVQLNNELYSLKGDANNIKDVMQPTVDDLYSKITTGADSATILLILENISGLQNSKADKTELNDIWSLINALSARIPNSTINYYFAYKVSTQVPQRPGNDLEYVPSGWTGYPIEPNSDEVLYMTMARTLNGNWLNWDGGYRWTQPIAYSDNQLTLNIEGNVALYKLSAGAPTLTDEERRTAAYPSGWSTTPDFVVQDNKEVYMITAKTLNGDFILVQGYYWSAPMRIGNGTTSGTGADGNSYNYVYFPSSSPNAPSTPTFTVAQIEQSLHIGGWYDRPLGVNENRMYEYISLSMGNNDNRKGWTSPVLWSKWGERGMDGDAVEYIYKTNNTGVTPTIPSYDPESAAYKQDDYVPSGWTDNPTGVTENTPYEYVAIRKKKDEVWQPFENPVLWAKYGKDGNGSQGPSGAIIRYIGDWSSVVENVTNHEFTFEYNTPEGANIRYIDVVTMPATSGGLDYYQCKEAYTTNATSPSPDLDSIHWEPAQHFKFLVTDTLISNVIAAGSISANDVVIKLGEGLSQSIVAGMTSSTAKYSTLGDVRIWAGTEGDLPNILQAPFLVTLEGKLIANDVAVLGEVKAISGIFQGQILAKSLKVQNLEDCGMQFKVLEEAITINGETYAAGTPVIMIWQGENVYVVNMTATSNVNKTSYSTLHVCVPVTGTESQILLNLKYCYESNITNLPSESSRFTTRDVYVVFSTDPLLDGLYLSTNPNDVSGIPSALRFSGIIIEQRLYSEFTQTSGTSSGSGIYRYYYNATTCRDGREITTSLITVAIIEAENNTVVKSNTVLYPVTSTAPEVSSQPFGYKITSSQVNEVLNILNFSSSDLVYPGTTP